jgi:hypothetical protein
MSKEVQMTFRIEPELRAEFTGAALQEHRPAAQVLREFMRAYVIQSRERGISPENDSISAAERRRREDAASFALASVGLEGFKPSKQALAQTRRHINGEIQLSELVQVKPDAKQAHSR